MNLTASRRAAETLMLSYITVMKAVVCLLPMIGILLFLVFAEPNTRFFRFGFHELAVTFSVLSALLLSYISYRGYIKTRSPFIYYIALGYLTFAVTHIPYGVFTRWTFENPTLFSIFGPASRLMMAGYLLVGVLHLGGIETRKRIGHWRQHILSALIVVSFLATLVTLTTIDATYVKFLEYGAVLVSLCSVAVIAFLRVRTVLMNYHLVAQAFLVQACLAFLLAEPWNTLWWFGHVISTAAFLILGYAVAVSYRYGRSFETIYNDTIYYKWRVRELARMNDALKNEVAERKRAEGEADSLRRAAEQSSRLKDEFLATLSHELRTPANVILGYSELLNNNKVTREELHEATGAIVRNARAQNQLIDQLLDISRIITGKMALSGDRLDLNQIGQSVVESSRLAALAKNIALNFKPFSTPLFVLGDSGRIQQIFWNLISNAIKFTPPNGEVNVVLTKREGNVEIQVNDNGEGINPSYLPRLFDKFSQQDGSSTRKHGGLGLGLSIVRHLTELHGGTVGAASAGPGRGASFIVRLPLAEMATHPPGKSESVAVEKSPLKGLRVLVVDDAPDVLGLVATILKKYGARVETASSASQALERLRQVHPDVLISDISMPGEDGYSLIRKVRQLDEDWARRVPAAALTAYAGEEDKRAAVQAGFQMHIAKPINSTSLVHAIQRLHLHSINQLAQ